MLKLSGTIPLFAVLACLISGSECRNLEPFPKNCGRPKVDPSRAEEKHNRIVGGTKAQDMAWPFIATVFKLNNPDNDGYDSYCGASIINNEWLVTAAHCLTDGVSKYSTGDFRISVGRNDLTPLARDHSKFRALTLTIRRTIVHEYYNPGINFQNDIGLMQLSQPLEFSDKIQTICLPTLSPEEMYYAEKGKLTALVAGWGQTKWKNGVENESSPFFVTHFMQGKSLTLQQISVPVEPSDQCETPHHQICALNPMGSRSTCQGDSGGPLIMKAKNGEWQLYGAVSNAVGCSITGHKTKLASIHHLKSWIENKVKYT